MTQAYASAFWDGLRPDPDLTVWEWADQHRMLSSKASAEPGRWRTDRTPYLREIMTGLSANDPTQRIVFMKSAQIGGTEVGNCWIGYVIHHAPAPMLYILPTVEIAEKASKQRIAPMLDESPALRELVSPARSRDSGNTLLSKEFRGGVFMMTGANSAAGLRSMPIKFLFGDEIDAWPLDVENEGSPLALAEKRTTTFARRKVFLVSTPTLTETSRVSIEYERSDKRRYFVPCPHCGHMQWLRWRGFNDKPKDPQAHTYRLVWTDATKKAAAYICGECGAHIEERHKTSMLRAGEWRATAAGDGVTKGYHINSLYSPAGWKSWVEILQEFELASKDQALLKTFVNTTLGEPFEELQGSQTTPGELQRRAPDIPLRVVQWGLYLLTAGVDTQGDRLEAYVWGWGRGMERQLVDRRVIYGDPGLPEGEPGSPWTELTEYLRTPFEHVGGGTLMIRAAFVDSGGSHTQSVYGYTRRHQGAHVYSIKGASVAGKSVLGKPSDVDINWRGQKIKKGVKLWPIGTDTAKAEIYGRLRTADPGAGYVHLSKNLPAEVFEQLTAERQVVKYVKGHARMEWVKPPGKRNEALDCAVYALAAAIYVGVDRWTAADWDRAQAVIQPKAKPKEDAVQAKPVPMVKQAAPVVARQWQSSKPMGRLW
jgi:phage terminase large subunit GpA-like protein